MMRERIHIMQLWGITGCYLLLILACNRDELHYPIQNKATVTVFVQHPVNPNIEPLSQPNIIYLGIYNADNKKLIRREVIEEVNVKQELELELGRYKFVVYNEPYINGESATANSVYYAGGNSWETLSVFAQGYVAASSSGESDRFTSWIEDVVMSDRINFFEIIKDTTLYFYPKVVFPEVNITLQVKNYTGWIFRRSSGSRPYITGVAAGYALGSGIYSDNLSTMFLDFKPGSAPVNGITTFRTSSFLMGFPNGAVPHPNLQTEHTLFVRFDYPTPTGVESRPIFINLQNGDGANAIRSHYTQAGAIRPFNGKKYHYDIWDLTVFIELEERMPVGGGFDAGLDDWENENVPLTKGKNTQMKLTLKTNKDEKVIYELRSNGPFDERLLKE